METKAQRFPMGRVGNSVLQRIFRNSHRFNIEIQILVGLVMVGKRCAEFIHQSLSHLLCRTHR
ncbi:hypothetical protein [Leptospira noguchii]|uniref:hypothetical protein n=1 Tax=Leptospira noguchii TaxID=28182 RepID=UPI000316C9EE|nr:hypothetical protein [Leptospira noguchii]